MYYPGVVAGKIKSFNYDHVGCYRYNLISDQTIFDPYFYTDSINSGNTVMSLFSSHEHVCDVSDLSSCAMTAGFTGHLNNLDYSVCVEQQYGFCGVEYSSADPTEIGPFSLSNKTKTNNGEEDEVGTGG